MALQVPRSESGNLAKNTWWLSTEIHPPLLVKTHQLYLESTKKQMFHKPLGWAKSCMCGMCVGRMFFVSCEYSYAYSCQKNRSEVWFPGKRQGHLFCIFKTNYFVQHTTFIPLLRRNIVYIHVHAYMICIYIYTSEIYIQLHTYIYIYISRHIHTLCSYRLMWKASN